MLISGLDEKSTEIEVKNVINLTMNLKKKQKCNKISEIFFFLTNNSVETLCENQPTTTIKPRRTEWSATYVYICKYLLFIWKWLQNIFYYKNCISHFAIKKWKKVYVEQQLLCICIRCIILKRIVCCFFCSFCIIVVDWNFKK